MASEGGGQGSAGGEPASGAPPLLELKGIAKSYGKVDAVKPLDLAIRPGDFYAILGPSGCGKTTLLRIIGGFVKPSAGRLFIAGTDMTRVSADRRPTNMVFQGYGLFPHMNVRQNIGYGLRLAKVPAEEARRRVDEILALGRIEALAERGISELSGGQQQRVALARALVMKPRVLLLDEPLAALDLKLRQAMQEELRRLHREIGGTFVFVTHDQSEAMALANRIAVMQAGEIVQEGAPEAVYSAPRTRFVASFIGEANIFEGRRGGGRVTLKTGIVLESPGRDGPVIAMIRPEKLRIGRALPGGDIVLAATLVDRVFLGTHMRLQARLADGAPVFAHVADAMLDAEPGEAVEVGWARGDARILDDA